MKLTVHWTIAGNKLNRCRALERVPVTARFWMSAAALACLPSASLICSRRRSAWTIPHDEIKALVGKYLGSTRRAGQGTAPQRTHRLEDVLARTRFGVPRQFFVPGIRDLLRDSESVLSGYLSLSSSAPHLFGDRLDDFAGEVRTLLGGRSAEGLFWDWPGDTEVVIARKPG